MNSQDFLKQLEFDLRKDAAEKTDLYLKAEKKLNDEPTNNRVAEHFHQIKRVWKLSTKKYNSFIAGLNGNNMSLN